MRDQRGYLATLAQLHQLGDAEERRVAWRQGMAALAACVTDREPAPLEGLPPEALLAGMRASVSAGLLEDLGFLSPAAAAVALFELASALPPGAEKRELGRRVLLHLHDADAATFASLATALALSSRRPLHGAPVRARVALLLGTRAGLVPGADALALALVSRRDLDREWLSAPSTGSLPSRRLAARLLERAAREAARRLDEGDESSLGVFARPAVRDAWERLLEDRESLVWRHVAIARGLLAHANYGLAREIDQDLAPEAGPGPWRRGAMSLAASLARERERALERCRSLLGGPIVKQDPGVVRSLVAGLGFAFEVEPEAAEQIAAEAIAPGGLEAVEALVELRRERDGAAPEAAKLGEAWLRVELARPAEDDGRTALLQHLYEELSDGAIATEGPLRAALRAAREAFLAGDAPGAMRLGREALAAVGDALDWLEQHGDGDAADRRHAYRLLRELDLGLLETGALGQLLSLGTTEGKTTPTHDLAALLERLERWLVAREVGAAAPAPAERVPHFLYRIARWRALVRVLDAEVWGEDVASRRERRLRAVATLAARARVERPPLRRAAWAALMRGWDALLRDDQVELSDALLGLGMRAGDDDLPILCEATMLPDVERLLHAYLQARTAARAAAAAPDDESARRAALRALAALARSLPPATSARVEALRTGVLRIGRALDRLSGARALAEVPADALERLGHAAAGLAQLVAGAARRLGAAPTEWPASGTALRAVSLAIERALRGEPGGLAEPITYATAALAAEQPPAIADAAAAVLARLARLPVQPDPNAVPAAEPARAAEPSLPSWLPPSRTLGGYYVMRPLGAGAGGSVFVACRADARHAEQAELYALKVPDYDGGAARQLSEEEFAQLFREEARALLAVPSHENLAGFVTFDAGARPKPILVMELVQGATLEQVLELGGLDGRAALAILDGIAGGLEAMHEARVAHLDVKPANIILRGLDLRGSPRAFSPVLVDFGLAGRKLRPGCGSPHYGAPEVWSAKLAGSVKQPFGADVYAFACLAYELLTGQVLVGGDNVMAVVSSQVTGAGWRAAISQLGAQPGLGGLAELLAACLARDADKRPPMGVVREQLRALAPSLAERAWPLGAG